jgi:hypothetical protein
MGLLNFPVTHEAKQTTSHKFGQMPQATCRRRLSKKPVAHCKHLTNYTDILLVYFFFLKVGVDKPLFPNRKLCLLCSRGPPRYDVKLDPRLGLRR